MMVGSTGGKIMVNFRNWPCDVCRKRVHGNSVQGTVCKKMIHKRCSGDLSR